MTAGQPFEIRPSGTFSLAQANAFGFGPKDPEAGARMTLAFAADGDFAPAGVELEQGEDGVVRGVAFGAAPLDVVVGQVARVLSLDHDGEAWAAVLAREAPLAALDRLAPGLRPVLFHSPYEAAAWSIISARIHRAQGARLRDRIAERLGTAFDLGGERTLAFPGPERLLEGIGAVEGVPELKAERLRGVAQAALDGLFDVPALQAAGPESTAQQMLTLAGVGPFYAGLIAVRATGFADAFTNEAHGRREGLTAYGLPADASDETWAGLTDRWRPFRTWAAVLCRAAHAPEAQAVGSASSPAAA